MSKKYVMVQLPSYVYLRMDPSSLAAFLSADTYEYDWENKTYHPSNSHSLEMRTASEEQFRDTPKGEKKDE